MSTKQTCKNCVFWKNQQAELEYATHNGICICHKWKFGTNNYGDVKVLDRVNRSEKYMGVNRFESASVAVPIGVVDKSRYCLVTEEQFGCIYFKKK